MYKRPELDTKNPPGQIVNPIPKQECEKLTFDEWAHEQGWLPDLKDSSSWRLGYNQYHVLKQVWKAAQENK